MGEVINLQVTIEKQQTILFFNNIDQLVTKVNLLKQPCVILSDETIYKCHRSFFDNLKITFHLIMVPCSEAGKTIESYQKVVSKMLNLNLPKNTILLGIGGGALLDLAGFVAATYKRGISYQSIPTTTLAQVDACCGGKCGINAGKYKNQIGLLSFASITYICTAFLRTLTPRIFNAGVAEIIKYGLIHDHHILTILETLDPKTLHLPLSLVYRCIEAKKHFIISDVNDTTLRQALNYGHTIGHAYESYHDFKVTHGEAVVYGMLYETTSLPIKNLISQYARQFSLMPTTKIAFNDLRPFIVHDKKWQSSDTITLVEVTNCGTYQLKKGDLATLERIYHE